jgi:hypothetical protein
MPKITLNLSDERYAALTKTQQLMQIAGGPSTTPEEYAQFVMDGACDSYAAQHSDITPEGLAAQLSIQKDATARAEAKAADAVDKLAKAEDAAMIAIESEMSIRQRLEQL